MISLTCTKCRATLTIDDAFAGGVCRCQHCGTIQTVPARAKAGGQSSGAIHQAAAGGSAKALYQTKKKSPAAGSGLDELGQVIASSGLSSSRLRKPMRTPDETPDSGAQRRALKITPVMAGSIAAAVVGLILVLWLTFGGGDGASGSGVSGPGTAVNAKNVTPPGVAVTGPNFAGIPLDGDEVVYVLDRGAASRESMGDIKEATFRSIASLGAEKRFRIVFWDTGSVESFPPSEPTLATADNLAAARKAAENVVAFGASDAKAAIESAARNKPDEIVLVTAKGWEMDDAFVKMVKTALGGAGSKVHTLSVGEPSASLQSISKYTGGTAVALSLGELRVAGK